MRLVVWSCNYSPNSGKCLFNTSVTFSRRFLVRTDLLQEMRDVNLFHKIKGVVMFKN